MSLMFGQTELANRKARQSHHIVLLLISLVVVVLGASFSVRANANSAPILNPIPAQQVFPDQVFIYRVRASDVDGNVPGIRMLNAPSGASLADLYDGTREFRWSVPTQIANQTVIIFQAVDAVDSSLIATQRMVLSKANPADSVVNDANLVSEELTTEDSEPDLGVTQNSAPLLPDIGQQALQVNQEYQLYIRPTDPDNTVPGLTTRSLPDGAFLEDAFDGSRLLRWRPNTNQVGEHRILLIAIDAVDSALRTEREVLFVVASNGFTDNVQTDSLVDGQTDASTTIDITNETLEGATQASEQLPYIEPISTHVVGVGQLVNFRVVPRMPDKSAAILHVDRLPGNASFDDNLDGTRTFHWPTRHDEQGEHTFRFTAIHADDVSQRVSTEVMVVIGDPTEGSSEPEIAVDESSESDTDTAEPDSTETDTSESGDLSGQNLPPIINPIAPQRVQVATELRFRVIATDKDGGVPGLHIENAVGDVRFEDNGDGSREFFWRPSDQQVGTYTFKVVATDNVDSSLVTSMLISVEVLSDGTVAEIEHDKGEATPPTELNNSARAQTPADAARFLQRASFGPNMMSVNKLMQQTYSDWISDQMNIPQTRYLDGVDSVLREYGLINIIDGRRQFDRQQIRSDIFWNIAVTAPDQLRQRVAFALGQILVVSDKDAGLDNRVRGIANYHDLLAAEAFGNYRTLLGKVTLNPMMGDFLSMRRNEKPDLENNIQSDENYAREVMQLFSIGPTTLQLNGDSVIGSNGQPAPTYGQEDVVNLARVFTGWNYGDASVMRTSTRTPQSEIIPMKAFQAFHDTSAKTILGNVAIEEGLSAQAELDFTLDALFNHPNVAPFVSRQLIQRLVSSNPSGNYIARVASIFINNGQGVRGDLAAVVRAILLDEEALNGHAQKQWDFGKLKEPIVKIASIWRAFDASGSFGKFRYSGINADFLQSPYSAPSVFNFYSANYTPPGIIADQNKVAPEAQILNDTTILRAADRLFDYAHEVPLGTASNSNQHAIVLNIEAEKALAHDVPKLVDHLRDKLLAGSMTDGLRSALVELGNATPLGDNGEQRVRELLYVFFISPEFAVQR